MWTEKKPQQQQLSICLKRIYSFRTFLFKLHFIAASDRAGGELCKNLILSANWIERNIEKKLKHGIK